MSGTLKSLHFDADASKMELHFTPNPEGGESKIFLSRRLHYPSGWDVSVAPSGCCSVADDANGNGIVVTLKRDVTADDISVIVTRK